MTTDDTRTRPELNLTWHGHATALIEIDGVRLLTDPVMRDRVGPLVRVGQPLPADAGRDIDAVLLSHLHADHADRRSLRMLDPHTPVIAPVGAAAWLRGQGLDDVRELEPGAMTAVGALTVTATPARHDGRRWPYGRRADSIGLVAERAALAAAMIAPRVAVPIHWGTLALPSAVLRPSDAQAPAREFAACAALRAPQVEVRILQPGEHTILGGRP